VNIKNDSSFGTIRQNSNTMLFSSKIIFENTFNCEIDKTVTELLKELET